jgi:hypothetical protein
MRMRSGRVLQGAHAAAFKPDARHVPIDFAAVCPQVAETHAPLCG